ncbi:hypothetical protein BGY98DRAFT_1052786 [Russula aff. rugulosa BPL654]|nr:hypothetical protein BGY98DRAFT_1052786 [Russula aff. rugulosa BPL654]
MSFYFLLHTSLSGTGALQTLHRRRCHFQSEGDLFGIHMLVHKTSTRKVNERGRKSLRESQLQERTNRVKRT